MEDHFESRNIRFTYVRPFSGNMMPVADANASGLVLLGGGPYGTVSGHLLPCLAAEIRLAREFMAAKLPVIGIGLGAQVLAVAAGGGAVERGLTFSVGQAHRVKADALNGLLPEVFPTVVYMRDEPVLPKTAEVLAEDESGRPALFQLNGNCLGFLGHPGIKSAMVEDLIMEFAETPPDPATGLAALREVQGQCAEALSSIMVGLVQVTSLMQA
jgi:GMP synthase-like glutamine amidotransferase